MSTELIKSLKRSEFNKIIQQKLKDHLPNVGTIDGADKLPEDIVANMNGVVESLCSVVQELNQIFIDRNITANSSDAYVLFLCDLLSEYLLVPSFEELNSLSKPEIETFVATQVASTPIATMRSALITHTFENQTEPYLHLGQIQIQHSVIDDETIKEEYKNLLMKQINVSK